QSSLQAQNAFTDATNLHSSVSLTISPVVVGPGQTLNWSASATCLDQGGTNCSSFSYTNGGPVENGYTISLVRTGNSNCGGSQTTIATTSTSGGTGSVGGTSA